MRSIPFYESKLIHAEGTLPWKRGPFWKDSLGKGSRVCSGGRGYNPTCPV